MFKRKPKPEAWQTTTDRQFRVIVGDRKGPPGSTQRVPQALVDHLGRALYREARFTRESQQKKES